MENTAKVLDEAKKVYEDEKAIVILAPKPTALGHLQVFPKDNIVKVEDIDEETWNHLMFVASFSATAIFEGLGLQGTNIIINNGEAGSNPYDRLCINILPRKTDDGIDLEWEPKKLEPQDFETIEKKIKDETFYVGKEAGGTSESVTPTKKEIITDQNNYLVRQLKRIP